jgi:hypothetical protein
MSFKSTVSQKPVITHRNRKAGSKRPKPKKSDISRGNAINVSVDGNTNYRNGEGDGEEQKIPPLNRLGVSSIYLPIRVSNHVYSHITTIIARFFKIA